MKARVPGLTVKKLKMMKGTFVENGPLWEGEMAETHHKISLQQKLDAKNVLLSLMEQNTQKLQLRLNVLGEITEHARLPLDSEILHLGLKLMTPIAERYARGELTTKDDLRNARDATLKESVAPKPTEKKSTERQNIVDEGAVGEPPKIVDTCAAVVPPKPVLKRFKSQMSSWMPEMPAIFDDVFFQASESD